MNEKEFLIKFLEFCYDKYNPLAKDYHPEYEQRLNESTAEFLRVHHMKYKSVYFYKWEGREKDIIREQVKIRLWDFLTSLGLDEESLDAKVNTYIERTI